MKKHPCGCKTISEALKQWANSPDPTREKRAALEVLEENRRLREIFGCSCEETSRRADAAEARVKELERHLAIAVTGESWYERAKELEALLADKTETALYLGEKLEESRAELAHEQERNRLNVAQYSETQRVLEAERDRLREAAQQLGGAVGDVLIGWDARRQLDQGFGGMGENILTEAAGKYQSIYHWGRVRKHYDALCAALRAPERVDKP